MVLAPDRDFPFDLVAFGFFLRLPFSFMDLVQPFESPLGRP